VELHWALWTPAALPVSHPDPEAIAQRAGMRPLGDQSLKVPSPEDALILSAGALARGRFDVPLRAWADLYWLLRGPHAGVRTETLMALAARLGVSGFIHLMVRLVDWLFGVRRPGLPQPTDAVARAEARLRPIVVRRLLEGTHRSDRHAWLLQATRTTGEREQPRGGRLGHGALRKAARYAAGLALSGRQRKELREELAINRVLADLQRAESGVQG